MAESNLLLVEDDPDRALLTKRALSQSGADPEVTVAQTASEACELLSDPETPLPDLVLLDLRLPGEDGFVVLDHLQECPSLEVPVVVLTSSDENEDMLRSYSMGANGFVTKPVDYDRFRKAVKSIARFWLEVNRPPPRA